MPAPADAQSLYQERAERIRRAMALEPVDRLPVIYMGTAFSPRYTGMSIARFCADPQARVDATLAAMERLGDLDGINAVAAGRITPALSRMWLSRVAVPGRDLPEDSLWQVDEAEVMTISRITRRSSPRAGPPSCAAISPASSTRPSSRRTAPG